MSLINEMKTGLSRLEQDNRSLRKFAVVISSVLVFIGLLVFFFGRYPERASWLGGTAVVLILLGLPFPLLIKPLHTFWMGLALFIGYFMSRLLLSLLFFIVFSPVSLFLRLLGKDILKQKIDKSANSYWIKKDKKDRSTEDYERQF
ncbi:hypothetical protein JXQ31_06265 [candidate division KSB1 bacterium]|nr:hypothetical protein [candidate division KSB1 bacterium]